MNKHRKHHKPEKQEMKLCTAVVEGRVCSYGDSCRYSHDISTAMALRPPDLGEECPIFTLRGTCKFGVNCRFGTAHLEPTTGASRRVAVDVEPYEELNVVSTNLIHQLRKKAVDFKKVDALAEGFTAAVAQQHDLHQAGQQYGVPTAEAAAGEAEAAAGSADASKVKAEGKALATTQATLEAKPAAEKSTVECVAAAYRARVAEECAAPMHERKLIDFRGKLYLAPLTTVGNLPFRRVCKKFGVDITCGEMALGTSLLQGSASEWALLKRHPCEDIFGVQIAGNQAQAMGRVAQLIEDNSSVDFVDINMGCPIDSICNKGMGSAMALRPGRIQSVVRTMSTVLSCPLTVKMRVGYEDAETQRNAHKLIPKMSQWGASAITLHGRSRQQRYSRAADWDYIKHCAGVAAALPQHQILGGQGWADDAAGGGGDRGADGAGGVLPLIGNGDVFCYEDVHTPSKVGGVSAVMVARGALVKPWVSATHARHAAPREATHSSPAQLHPTHPL